MNWLLKGLYFLVLLISVLFQTLIGGTGNTYSTAGQNEGSSRDFSDRSGTPYGNDIPHDDVPYDGTPHDGIPYDDNPYNENPYNESPYNENPYAEIPYGENPYGDGFNMDPYRDYGESHGDYGNPYGDYENPYGDYTDPFGGGDTAELSQEEIEEIRNQYQEMGAVLRQLGLSQFTEERMEKEADEHIWLVQSMLSLFPEWLEEEGNSKGNPDSEWLNDYMAPDYRGVLSSEGYGNYDDNWIWHPSSDSVYSFDCESLDSSRMYTYFLRGVLAISGEEFSLTYIEESQKEVDLYSNSGAQTLSFRYNDTPYYFRARYMGDWMDCTIIDFMNNVFETEGNSKRLWCTGDGWQGYILFYNTEEWAKEFQEATGLELSDSYLYSSRQQADAF